MLGRVLNVRQGVSQHPVNFVESSRPQQKRVQITLWLLV